MAKQGVFNCWRVLALAAHTRVARAMVTAAEKREEGNELIKKSSLPSLLSSRLGVLRPRVEQRKAIRLLRAGHCELAA